MDINNEEQNEIEIDLRELFFHIKRYWYIVVVSILVGVLGAAFYLWKIEVPQYQATAMIYMRDSNTQISVSDLQVNQELSSDYMVILKSRPVLNRIISDLDVDMTYDQLYNSTTISTIDDTRIIKITVTNTNAQIAADLANQLVDRGVDTVEEIESKQPYTVEKAVVDNNKINTSNKKVLLMGMLLGLVASIGGLFIQFMLNDKVRSADDIEKLLRTTIRTPSTFLPIIVASAPIPIGGVSMIIKSNSSFRASNIFSKEELESNSVGFGGFFPDKTTNKPSTSV